MSTPTLRTPDQLLKLAYYIFLEYERWNREDGELQEARAGLDFMDRDAKREEQEDERIRLRRAEQIRKLIA